jgi:hypothetical protein
MSNTTRKDTINLLNLLKGEVNNLASKQLEEAAEKIRLYSAMLEKEKRRRGR